MSDIVIMGATYPSVPAVQLPKAGGGTATFTETAGSQTFTENGTYDVTSLEQAVVDVSGGGGDDGSFKAVIERTATTPTLPSDLTTIGAYAFYGCTNLALTSLPSNVTSIGNNAFYNCGKLALTELPSGVTSIGNYAFQNCTDIALTSLPSDITSIGQYTFAYCTKIAMTELPEGITTLGYGTFQGCSALALTKLPSGLKSIPNNAFQGCINLALTELPSAVTSIGNDAFKNCQNLRSVECDGNISSLSSGAFLSSSNTITMQIASVSFPNMTVSSLGPVFGYGSSFGACRQLAFADVGKTKAIAANAFANCYALTTLVLRRTDAICALSNTSAFNNTPMSGRNGATGTVYVPQALIPTYQAATNWKTLYDGGTLSFAAIEGSEYEI